MNRRDLIDSWLETVLSRYARPAHMLDAQARAELADMVHDVDATVPAMPVEALHPFLCEVWTKLRRSHMSRTWPTIAALCKAISAAAREAPSTSPGRPSACRPDVYAKAAERIRARQPVEQAFVYGGKAKELIARGLIGEADLEVYRGWLIVHLREVYGEEAEGMEAALRKDHATAPMPTSPMALAAARSRRGRGGADAA